jgi:hypothetical protein
VVSVTEKAHMMRQVRVGKANESEPPMRRRNSIDDIKTGVPLLPRDQPGRGPVYCPGGVRRRGGASPIQVPVWNVGTPRSDAAGGMLRPLVKERSPSSTYCEGLSIDAEQAGGSPCSSAEAPVMGVERRRRVVQVSFGGQPEFPGGAR